MTKDSSPTTTDQGNHKAAWIAFAGLILATLITHVVPLLRRDKSGAEPKSIAPPPATGPQYLQIQVINQPPASDSPKPVPAPLAPRAPWSPPAPVGVGSPDKPGITPRAAGPTNP